MKMSHGHRLERRAGRVGAALVVAGDDDPLALVLEHDLRRAEDVAGGDEADVDLAEPDRLAIGDRLARLRPVAAVHDRQRLGRRPDRVMAAAGMVGMAVGDQRASALGCEGSIHASAGRDVNAFGKRLDPGTETGHAPDMAPRSAFASHRSASAAAAKLGRVGQSDDASIAPSMPAASMIARSIAR